MPLRKEMAKEPFRSKRLSTAFQDFGFRKRMGLPHHLAQMFSRDMGIDLGCGNIGMAKEGLHATQIRPSFHQMRGKGMAQNVWGDFGGIKSRLQRQVLEQLVE